jgi:hypothetical protein
MSQPRSSRHRYQTFRQGYKERKLDAAVEIGVDSSEVEASGRRRGNRRDYIRNNPANWAADELNK